MRALITVTDDGGPVRGRLSVNCSPGLGNGDASPIVSIGSLELRVAGVEEIAAERCEAIAAEFHRMALELLRTTIAGAPPLDALVLVEGERPRLFVELAIGTSFRFEHYAGTEDDHVWTKTGDREYSRIYRKRIGTTHAPVLELSETAAAASRAAAAAGSAS